MLTSPKQFEIKEISPKLACEYNKLWHSSLPDLDYTNVIRNKRWVTYGAFYEDECYAVGIWSSPVNRRWNVKPYLELRRFAISDRAPYNTASFLLSKMIKDIRKKWPELEKLVSYQNREIHTGTIYKASNWVCTGKTNPSIWKNNKERTIESSKNRWEYIL